MRDYLPIAEHGVIGNLHTVALVGTDGAIDWYCCPRFDSPSVFAAILDKRQGGFFRIAPLHQPYAVKQLYFPDTNVLITRFLHPHGVGEIEDFMPVAAERKEAHKHRLVRRLVQVRGEMVFRVEVEPRFNYGLDRSQAEVLERGVLFRSPNLSLALQAPCPFRLREGGAVAEVALRAGESATFVLERVDGRSLPRPYSERETRTASRADDRLLAAVAVARRATEAGGERWCTAPPSP